MANIVHVATLILKPITPTGTVLNKNTMSTGQSLTASSESRVNQDSSLPHTANYPTLATYLQLEANDGFKLVHLDQTYVITQNF